MAAPKAANDNSNDKKYHLSISMVNTTDGGTDGEVFINEYSSDPEVHAYKQSIFTKHLTAAVNAATQELIAMGLSAMSGK